MIAEELIAMMKVELRIGKDILYIIADSVEKRQVGQKTIQSSTRSVTARAFFPTSDIPYSVTIAYYLGIWK